MKKAAARGKAHPTHAVVESYKDVLTLLTGSHAGRTRDPRPASELLFIRNVQGVEKLFETISAVGPAKSGASDEEWNPLSQRPHSPLPPNTDQALGVEIWALKEAVEAFTTLAHEMMHIAMWEPFFTGRWKPRGKAGFVEFSLLAEGYCFFFSDIIVSGAVRVRLPDGEYALERNTSENARFHPSRAFKALGIESREEVLDIYLEGFRGSETRLWQPRGTSAYASSLAAQVHDFYIGSQLPLHEMHGAIEAFGGISEFHRRFCAIPGLPTFLGKAKNNTPGGADLKDYFSAFFATGLESLEALRPAQVSRLRDRRMLQMRAYYALQVRWLIRDELVLAQGLSAKTRIRLVSDVDAYLSGLEGLLRSFARNTSASPADELTRLDAVYDTQVRKPLAAHDAWVGRRWMIIPRRAGGFISAVDPAPTKAHDAKVMLLRLSAYLVDELTHRMRRCKTIPERAKVMRQIQTIAALGAAGDGTAARAQSALRRLQTELSRPYLRDLWSVPLTSFDPAGNRFRELVFSYK